MIKRIALTLIAATTIAVASPAAASSVPPGCVLNEGIPGDPGFPDGLDRVDCPEGEPVGFRAPAGQLPATL